MKTHAIIFDVNDTLITRVFGNKKDPLGTAIGNYTVYPKKHLSETIKFLNEQPVTVGVWSTMMQKNLIGIVEYLKDQGLGIDFYLSQENCSEGEMTGNIKTKNCKKDLRKVSELTSIPLQNCILVDDSIGKRVENQNFYEISDSTEGLKGAIKFLEEFLNILNYK